MQFMIKRISHSDLLKELEDIGFDESYRERGAKKHDFISLKIFDLTPQQAIIIKQSAISVGTDCAIHRHVIDFKIKKTDCILSGSICEFEKLCEKLEKQPFSLKKLVQDIKGQIKIHKTKQSTVIMGILNITSNSFSDGGNFLDHKKAFKHAEAMIKEGAEIIDIGAESTAPGAKPVSPDVEIKRIVPIIKEIRKKYPEILISVDTRNSKTARETILAGADIINDVSGYSFDKKILDVAIEFDKKLVIMHSRGIPENMCDFTKYKNVVEEVYFELKQKCDTAISKGVKPENIIVDPGFGFAKNAEQNLELLKHVREFRSLGFQTLAGVSRKRFLSEFSDPKEPKNRDEITATTSFYLAQQGINIIRVHNVKLSFKAVNLAQKL